MTNWLNGKQQRAWRSFLSVAIVLPDQFSKDLQEKHDLTLSDYEILVRLSESPEHFMRMSDLADRVMSSRSRLTHQIDRMIAAGLVARTVCPPTSRCPIWHPARKFHAGISKAEIQQATTQQPRPANGCCCLSCYPSYREQTVAIQASLYTHAQPAPQHQFL